jgi:plastocyanin
LDIVDEFTSRRVDVVEAGKNNPNRVLLILIVSVAINIIMFIVLVVLLTTYAGSNGSSSQQKDMTAMKSRLAELESSVWEQGIETQSRLVQLEANYSTILDSRLAQLESSTLNQDIETQSRLVQLEANYSTILDSRLAQLESSMLHQDIETQSRLVLLEANTSIIAHATEKIESAFSELNAKINVMGNSSAAVDLKSSKFNIYQPVTYSNSQETFNGQRMWTHPSYSIYASDSIRWEWTSNENVVSTDPNGTFNENPIIHSGALSLGGSFVMQFTVPGTYYYGSENSQTMTGTVIVMEGPSITLSRESIEFKTPYSKTITISKPTSTVNKINVPVGVQLNLPLDGLDSCWVKCYEEGYDQTSSFRFSSSCRSSYSDSNWVLVGVKDSPNATTLKVAAFGRYNMVFATTYLSTSGTMTPTLENGVNWYFAYLPGYSAGYYNGYTSFGFSHDATIALTRKSHHIDSGSDYYYKCYYPYDDSTTSCEKRLSWSLYRDAGYVAGCTKTASELYRKIVMKNTCEVYSPTATS